MSFIPSKALLVAATAFCLLLLADAIRWTDPAAAPLVGAALNIAVFLHALATTFLIVELRKVRRETA